MALLAKVLPIQCADAEKEPPEPIGAIELIVTDDPQVWREVAAARKAEALARNRDLRDQSSSVAWQPEN